MHACSVLSYHQLVSVSRSPPVTPSLLLWVDVWVVLVTHLLPIAVELPCILLKEVAGCEITPATKPGLASNLQVRVGVQGSMQTLQEAQGYTEPAACMQAMPDHLSPLIQVQAVQH